CINPKGVTWVDKRLTTSKILAQQTKVQRGNVVLGRGVVVKGLAPLHPYIGVFGPLDERVLLDK
ncbi:hypothetical protein BHE74_00039699, partial [Ensete ventricosum]